MLFNSLFSNCFESHVFSFFSFHFKFLLECNNHSTSEKPIKTLPSVSPHSDAEAGTDAFQTGSRELHQRGKKREKNLPHLVLYLLEVKRQQDFQKYAYFNLYTQEPKIQSDRVERNGNDHFFIIVPILKISPIRIGSFKINKLK